AHWPRSRAALSSGATLAMPASSSRGASRTDGSRRRSAGPSWLARIRSATRAAAIPSSPRGKSDGAPGPCCELATPAPYGLIAISSDQLARVQAQPHLSLALTGGAPGHPVPERNGQRGTFRRWRPDEVPHDLTMLLGRIITFGANRTEHLTA